MKKVFALLTACALASVATAAGQTTAKTTQKKPVEILVIESTDYPSGKQDAQLTNGLANFLEGEAKVSTISYEEAQQDPKFANIDMSFLPVYLIKKTPQWGKKLEEALQAGYVQQNSDYYIFLHQTRTGVYQNKIANPGVLEIFVMSQCPYGVMAEGKVIDAKNDGKLPADTAIRVRYIVSYDKANNDFRSLHGSGEWEEDVRQLLIAKYYPEKFWKYLEIRNKDYRSSRWDKAMKEAGINPNKIMKKFDTEGVELLKAEAAYVDEYDIGSSPSFLWEGKELLDYNGLGQKPGLGFFNRNSSTRGAAAPAGSC
ncbi:MAG: hypothetical protein J6U96_02315 [Elusimicrobiaceae bacterium]|nr:hypothetical protein [Elusimicrobiaceae bacterium]